MLADYTKRAQLTDVIDYGDEYPIYDCKYIENSKTNKQERHLYIKSNRKSCCCPNCGHESHHISGSSERVIQEVPILGTRTILHIRTRRFHCDNPECKSKTFREVLPFAKKSQVRTDELNVFILQNAINLSNNKASQVLSEMGVEICGNSIKNLINRLKIKDDKEVERIGVDDVAIKKGQTYATAIYNYDTREMLALLPGREGDSLREWLKDHPNIKLVCRDRDNSYSSVLRDLCPDCVQIADRFHIIKNLNERFYDVASKELPENFFSKTNNLLKKKR